MKNAYFSCGTWCATAHQIRRFTGNRDAYFFDWLVTRDNSYNFLLMNDQQFLNQDNWKIIDQGIRLLDQYSGLAFQHEFKCHDSKVDIALVDGHLPSAFEKFTHLKNKLINALRLNTRPVVVRADGNIVTVRQAENELERLKTVFHKINSKVNFIVVSSQLKEEVITPDHLFIRVDEVLVESKDSWKGDDSSWDRVFLIAEESLRFDE